ncbi:MAG: DUF6524 family protein [Gemmatimonadales bacterium]|nr:DUF6524 family protein [Gemmatimonadales bacterium]
MQGEGVSGKGVLGRFLASLVLVYGTFNPEGYSYFHWAIAPLVHGDTATAGQSVPVKVLVALLLVGLWAFSIQTARRSIGWKGAILVLGIIGALVWALIDWQVLNPNSSRAIGHVVLVALAVVLALGMSWSHLSRKLSGQVDTDDIN